MFNFILSFIILCINSTSLFLLLQYVYSMYIYPKLQLFYPAKFQKKPITSLSFIHRFILSSLIIPTLLNTSLICSILIARDLWFWRPWLGDSPVLTTIVVESVWFHIIFSGICLNLGWLRYTSMIMDDCTHGCYRLTTLHKKLCVYKFIVRRFNSSLVNSSLCIHSFQFNTIDCHQF